MNPTKQFFTSAFMCFILIIINQTFASFSPNLVKREALKHRIEKLRNIKKRDLPARSKIVNHSLAKKQTDANTVSEVYIEEWWNGQEWEKEKRDSIVYTTNTLFGYELDPLFELSQYWDGSEWVNEYKYEVIYPDDLTRRGVLEWEWDNSSQSWRLVCMNCGRIDTLDNNGNEISLFDVLYNGTDNALYFTANEQTDNGFISYNNLIFTQERTIDSSEVSKSRWIRQSSSNDTIEYLVDKWDPNSDTWDEGVCKVFRCIENDTDMFDSILIKIDDEWKLQELDKVTITENSIHTQYSYYEMWFDPDLQEWAGDGTTEYMEYTNNFKTIRYTETAFEWNHTASEWEITEEAIEEFWMENGTMLESCIDKWVDEESGEWFAEGQKDTLISPFQDLFYRVSYWDNEFDTLKPQNRFSLIDSTDNILICLEEYLDDETDEWYPCSRRIGHLDNSGRIIEEIEYCYMDDNNHDCCGYITDSEIGWNLDTRNVYSYNENGLLESKTEWYWNLKQKSWSEDIRFIYPYGKIPSLDSKKSVTNKKMSFQRIKLSFQPGTGLLSVYTPVKQNIQLDIFTISGKKIFQLKSTSSGFQAMDIRSIIPSSGYYLAQLRTLSEKASTKIMLIR